MQKKGMMQKTDIYTQGAFDDAGRGTFVSQCCVGGGATANKPLQMLYNIYNLC